jgi:hypothetical protein
MLIYKLPLFLSRIAAQKCLIYILKIMLVEELSFPPPLSRLGLASALKSKYFQVTTHKHAWVKFFLIITSTKPSFVPKTFDSPAEVLCYFHVKFLRITKKFNYFKQDQKMFRTVSIWTVLR